MTKGQIKIVFHSSAELKNTMHDDDFWLILRKYILNELPFTNRCKKLPFGIEITFEFTRPEEND